MPTALDAERGCQSYIYKTCTVTWDLFKLSIEYIRIYLYIYAAGVGRHSPQCFGSASRRDAQARLTQAAVSLSFFLHRERDTTMDQVRDYKRMT